MFFSISFIGQQSVKLTKIVSLGLRLNIHSLTLVQIRQKANRNIEWKCVLKQFSTLRFAIVNARELMGYFKTF